jgi:hypothetical protein
MELNRWSKVVIVVEAIVILGVLWGFAIFVLSNQVPA